MLTQSAHSFQPSLLDGQCFRSKVGFPQPWELNGKLQEVFKHCTLWCSFPCKCSVTRTHVLLFSSQTILALLVLMLSLYSTAYLLYLIAACAVSMRHRKPISVTKIFLVSPNVMAVSFSKRPQHVLMPLLHWSHLLCIRVICIYDVASERAGQCFLICNSLKAGILACIRYAEAYSRDIVK